MLKKIKLLIILSASLCSCITLATTDLTTDEKTKIISKLASELRENYVYPDNAKKMSALLLKNLHEGKYAGITAPQQLGTKLTEDIYSIYQDKHLRVIFDPKAIKAMQGEQSSTDSPMAEINNIKMLQRNNFGFNQIKVLPGNLGYMDLRNFSSAEPSKETVAAAMTFVENTEALIIDLRKNTGGSPDMVALIASYFFNEKPVHLGGFYYRPTDTYSESYTLDSILGKRRPNLPLYILTSKRTFSAAEDFSYSLKHLKRATVIGEITGGGAHPVNPYIIGDRFLVSLPIGRSTNPITNTNWEGVGVQPDIKVAGEDALLMAQKLALKNLMENDLTAKAFYQWSLEDINVNLAPVNLTASKLKSYTGKFDYINISFDNGQLNSLASSGKKRKLTPLSKTTFKLADIDWVRFEFIVKNNQVVGIREYFDDGSSQYHEKSS